MRLSDSLQARLEALGGRGHCWGWDSTGDTAEATYISGVILVFCALIIIHASAGQGQMSRRQILMAEKGWALL